MSGPLASWVLAHTKATGPTFRLVAVTLALKANHDGTGADHTRGQVAALVGCDPSTVSRALRWFEQAGELCQGPIPGRGRPRSRTIVVRWCEDVCQPCAQLRKALTRDNLSAGKVLTRATKGSHGREPLRHEETRVTGQMRQAAATAGLRNGADPLPDDQGPENLELGSRINRSRDHLLWQATRQLRRYERDGRVHQADVLRLLETYIEHALGEGFAAATVEGGPSVPDHDSHDHRPPEGTGP